MAIYTNLVHLDDYRPQPASIARLYLNAWLRIWQGAAMLMAIPLAMAMRARR